MAADLLGDRCARLRGRGRARRLPRLRCAMALAVAAPMPEPPPVTTATWRAKRFSAALPSLACSSDQYSTSNMSSSEIGRYELMRSASVMTSTVFSAMSAAIAASFAEAPSAEKADARHKDHARERIELFLDAVHALVVAREIVVVLRDEGVDRGARSLLPVRRACRPRAPGTISGQFLVRMV